MYTHISVELLKNQKIEAAHRDAEKYRLLDQAAGSQARSNSTGRFIAWIFRKPALKQESGQINVKESTI